MTIKIMVFDIETTHLKVDTFRLGEQRINHYSLDPAHSRYGIITISYTDNVKNKPKCLKWDELGCSKEMMEEFTKVIKKYQDDGFFIFGKNNGRFDNKFINTLQWWHKAEPMPEWTKYVGDLEKLLRKHFYVPSQSLDYWSSLIGLGGKEKMEFEDWRSIQRLASFNRLNDYYTFSDKGFLLCYELFRDTPSNIVTKGKKALKKMCKYNIKDVTDTLAVLESVLPYIEIKNPMVSDNLGACKTCGSSNIRKNGTRGRYQSFLCGSCGKYAGRAIIKKDGTTGNIT